MSICLSPDTRIALAVALRSDPLRLDPGRVRAAVTTVERSLNGQPSPPRPSPKLMTQGEVAVTLKVSRWTVRRLRQTGVLLPVSIGGIERYRVCDIEKLLEAAQ